MSWVEAVWARNKANAYTDSAVAAIGTNMTYKGSKATVADLPATGQKKGDVWTISADGSEYVYDGSAWQKLGVTPSPANFSSGSATSGQFFVADGNGGASFVTMPAASGTSF